MLFLAHSAAQNIRLSEREACQHLYNLHYLFLIQNNAERFLQNRLQCRVHIRYFLSAVTAVDEVGNHAAAERSRAVQRHHRN